MKKWICPVLLLILMIGIFCMSAQPGEESEETSSGFTLTAARLMFDQYDNWDDDIQTDVLEGVSFIVRKAAHFSEYALMGFLWYIWLKHKRWNFFIAFGATAFYAMTDEFHQLFVPGRSGEIRDVLLDSTGGLCGILAAFVVLCIIHCIRHKDVVDKGIWK